MAIRVIRDLSGPLQQTIEIGKRRLTMEMSTEETGQSPGPNPHDLYDAALGACKALTVLWFAHRKGMPLKDMELSVTRDNSREHSGIYRLTVNLTLTGGLTQQARLQLLQAALGCPVEKLMTEVETQITTSLAETRRPSDAAAVQARCVSDRSGASLMSDDQWRR